MKKIKIGIIGLGPRGRSLMSCLAIIERDIEITMICDELPDRREAGMEEIKKYVDTDPVCVSDYMDVVNSDNVDAVIVSTAWEMHVPIACAAMKAGKAVGMEVGGAYSIDDCYELVRTYEQTKTPFMLLENCCYGERELMTLQMAREGKFGKISHCTGGYSHDLREEIADGYTTKHYRLRNYIRRNCDNYPTHQLGPIAKVLGINRGNRMISLCSVASKSNGLHEYVAEKMPDNEYLTGSDFRQGDVVNTIIKCAGGETILLTLDTCLPRFYSRNYSIRGTKGGYFEENDSLFFDNDEKMRESEWNWKPMWGNAEEYYNEHQPEIWKKYGDIAREAGHGGMDYMVLSAFIDALQNDTPMPINVYDAAAWICISVLSEDSIACGGAPVAIPDFTHGRWVKYDKVESASEFALD